MHVYFLFLTIYSWASSLKNCPVKCVSVPIKWGHTIFQLPYMYFCIIRDKSGQIENKYEIRADIIISPSLNHVICPFKSNKVQCSGQFCSAEFIFLLISNVFCSKNCSELLWEKLENNFANSRPKVSSEHFFSLLLKTYTDLMYWVNKKANYNK